MRIALCVFSISLAAQTVHFLDPTPATVVVGVYDPAIAPALRIKPGDIVEMRTLGVTRAKALEAAGVAPSDIEPALRAIDRESSTRGHFLTGPIYIEGAEPGDTLEVQIGEIRLVTPYAYNGMGPNGVLADLFEIGTRKLIRLDRARMVGLWGPGIEVPLRPFFGSLGVAPPNKVSSSPPGVHAGNLDNRELVAGTKLFIPVHVAGALFQAGDGHAAQGDGEVDQTGLETSLSGTFRFVLHKGMKLRWPRAETPTHYIAMGLDPELNVATKIAVMEAVDFLVTQKGMTRGDAYMLASVAVDLRITQLVDGTKGVHAMIPKSIFVGR
ncbi:MAG: acetamidase/formamidase family protein [Bryobacteraceae bacterium]|nr:acetamidase/formamidase family protein [Bryobacteraceae bacterium]